MIQDTSRPHAGPVRPTPRRPAPAPAPHVLVAASTVTPATAQTESGVASSGAHDTRDPTHKVVAAPRGLAPTGPDIHDWTTWLDLSATPPVTSRHAATLRFHLDGGRIVDPDSWPRDPASRIYAVFDDVGVVYVGQTSLMLSVRIRSHFSNQRTGGEQHKAGTWRFLVNATFPDLRPGELDRLERSAAEWLLPLRHRVGRRHPRFLPP